jgi:FkbM family methyltransferase
MPSNREALDRSVEIALAALHAEGRPLKILYAKGVAYFIFADDWPATQCKPENLFSSLGEFLSAAKGRNLATPGCSEYNRGAEFDLFRQMAGVAPQTVTVDIGANYARETVRHAIFRRSLNLPTSDQRPAILAFEPCPVRHVAALNIDLHDLPEVRLLPYAIGAANGYLPIAFGAENTLGGSLVAKAQGTPRELTVKVAALDSVLEQFSIDAPLFMKVDTQGAEPLVLEGMKHYLADHPICGIFEFAPGLLNKIVKPAEFLKRLLDRFKIFDFSQREPSAHAVLAAEADAFVADVLARDTHFTDLVLLDRRLNF